MIRKKSTAEKEMREYLLLNYPQGVRNNLKKLIKMPGEEEVVAKKSAPCGIEDGNKSKNKKKKGNCCGEEKTVPTSSVALPPHITAISLSAYHPCSL